MNDSRQTATVTSGPASGGKRQFCIQLYKNVQVSFLSVSPVVNRWAGSNKRRPSVWVWKRCGLGVTGWTGEKIPQPRATKTLTEKRTFSEGFVPTGTRMIGSFLFPCQDLNNIFLFHERVGRRGSVSRPTVQAHDFSPTLSLNAARAALSSPVRRENRHEKSK